MKENPFSSLPGLSMAFYAGLQNSDLNRTSFWRPSFDFRWLHRHPFPSFPRIAGLWGGSGGSGCQCAHATTPGKR